VAAEIEIRDNPLDYSVDELDRQYDARARVPDCPSILQAYAEQSAEARRLLACERNVPYGPHEDESLDIFPAAGDPGAGHPAAGVRTPVYIFIHGGYWRALSKDDSAFMAPAFVKAGATVVAVNYSLAPGASLHTMVQQCRKALAWIYRHIGQYNGDPGRLHVSGHSAGGHLAGMLLANDWQDASDVPADVVHSASPVSGLFDLRPLLPTRVNTWLGLDRTSALALSPVFQLPRQACPMLLAWGEHESEEFKRQSHLYGQAWQQRDFPAALLEVPNTNHFDIMLTLRDPDAVLTREIFTLMELPLHLKESPSSVEH
jgi:arylformamidase